MSLPLLPRLVCMLIPFPSLRRKLRRKLAEISFRAQVEAKLSALEQSMNIQLSTTISDMHAKGYARVHQLLTLEILVEIDRICRLHNIRYWLDWGTLLGAVRHKGFIPWDDDVDVAMMAEDYERFIAVLQDELGERFCFKRVPGMKGFLALKEFAPKTDDEWAAFSVFRGSSNFYFAVDIFPMHYLRDDFETAGLNVMVQQHLDWKRRMYRTKPRVWSTFVEIDKEVKSVMSRITSPEPTSRLILSTEHWSSNPVIHDTEDILPLCEAHFEGIPFKVPARASVYLWDLYGDWSTPLVNHIHYSFELMNKNDMRRYDYHGKRLGVFGEKQES